MDKDALEESLLLFHALYVDAEDIRLALGKDVDNGADMVAVVDNYSTGHTENMELVGRT